MDAKNEQKSTEQLYDITKNGATYLNQKPSLLSISQLLVLLIVVLRRKATAQYESGVFLCLSISMSRDSKKWLDKAILRLVLSCFPST